MLKTDFPKAALEQKTPEGNPTRGPIKRVQDSMGLLVDHTLEALSASPGSRAQAAAVTATETLRTELEHEALNLIDVADTYDEVIAALQARKTMTHSLVHAIAEMLDVVPPGREVVQINTSAVIVKALNMIRDTASREQSAEIEKMLEANMEHIRRVRKWAKSEGQLFDPDFLEPISVVKVVQNGAKVFGAAIDEQQLPALEADQQDIGKKFAASWYWCRTLEQADAWKQEKRDWERRRDAAQEKRAADEKRYAEERRRKADMEKQRVDKHVERKQHEEAKKRGATATMNEVLAASGQQPLQ